MKTFLNYLLSSLEHKSNFASLDDVWCLKNQTLMMLVAKSVKYFLYQTRVIQVMSNPIP